jgi:hypothetical protein
MSLPKYRVLVNGLYLRGWDDSETDGHSGHMGWQPRAVEMSKMLMTRLKDQARIVEGNIELKSQLNRIYDRVRYAGFELNRLVVERVPETPKDG